jgi:hypothetical protein
MDMHKMAEKKPAVLEKIAAEMAAKDLCIFSQQ